MSSHAPQPPAADCRCACGSLLARLVTGGVELKCRRCKRTHFVPLEVGSATPGARSGAARGARAEARG